MVPLSGGVAFTRQGGYHGDHEGEKGYHSGEEQPCGDFSDEGPVPRHEEVVFGGVAESELDWLDFTVGFL